MFREGLTSSPTYLTEYYRISLHTPSLDGSGTVLYVDRKKRKQPKAGNPPVTYYCWLDTLASR